MTDPVGAEGRMRRLFVPGPVPLFAAGWLGTSDTGLPTALLAISSVVSIPCSLGFLVASGHTFRRQNGGE